MLCRTTHWEPFTPLRVVHHVHQHEVRVFLLSQAHSTDAAMILACNSDKGRHPSRRMALIGCLVAA